MTQAGFFNDIDTPAAFEAFAQMVQQKDLT
jgi:molybdenum cofactor cytidylyltransferase